MKALDIAVKNLKSVKRNIKTYAIVFVLPIVFMSIFKFAFGQEPESLTFNMATVKNESPIYQEYIEVLKNIKNGNDELLFNISEFANEKVAVESVEAKKNLMLLNWSENDSVILKGDASNPYFNAASGIINQYTNQFFKIGESKVKVESLNIEETERLSGFEVLVPGLIIYGILIMLPQIAQDLVKVTEDKYIFRYFTSKASSVDIIGGYLISQTVLSIVQTIILFLAAYLLGYKTDASILPIIVVTVLVNFFVVGLGLLIGSMFKKSEPAQNTASILSIMLAFMSGSFIVLPDDAVTIKGLDFRFTDIFPSSHATEALRQVLANNKGIDDITNQLLIVGASSVIVLALGIVMFQQRQLKNLE